mmetsp:Transcript_9565/g.21976  ORF Transcript_9565/g.21976 Transcript_9565/m.21976 type:complete len:143 (+) Transcript_9565:2-430(+)
MVCCTGCYGLHPSATEQIAAQVREVKNIFPGTNFVVILEPDGKIVFEEVSAGIEQGFVGMVAALKRAALQFGNTLGQKECPVIHVKGSRNIFSYYDVGEHLLAFFTEMPGPMLEMFDTHAADNSMGPVVQNLMRLLTNAVTG